ncbi:siderophore-iron reductase FhuF [Ensifer soli]|uniref:siderophore-iron reductase FhuF n=1 Tax=Ciceribacter sp. sgz301302 TaxID=3342379 RepID=UPI0035B728F8
MTASPTSGAAGPAARDGAAGPVDFDRLLAEATGEKYIYCKGAFRLAPPEGTDCLDCTALLDAAAFHALIDRFAAGHGPAADRRAVVSLWTLYYFSTLTIAATVAWLEMRRRLPLALDEMKVCLDPTTGAPRAFVLSSPGSVEPGLSIEEGLHGLFRHHAEPLVGAIAASCGVSRKLLWGNVAAYVVWIVGEAGRLTDPRLALEGAALVDPPHWSDGWKNPLSGAIRMERDSTGAACARRRVCCLRYALPAVGGCGESCPLPQGRA